MDTVEELDLATYRRFSRRVSSCRIINKHIKGLSDFLSVFDGMYSDPSDVFWFRGHANFDWELCPSALRYEDAGQRKRALEAMRDFRRLQEYRLSKAPPTKEHFTRKRSSIS